MNALTDGHFGNDLSTDGRRSKPQGVSLGRSQSACSSKPQKFQKLPSESTENRQSVPRKARHIWSYSTSKEREHDYDKLKPAITSPQDALRPSGTCMVEIPQRQVTTRCGQTSKGMRKRIDSSTEGESLHGEQMSTSVPATPLMMQRKALRHHSSSGKICKYRHVYS